MLIIYIIDKRAMDDEILRLYVDEIFSVYDHDKSQTLDVKEIATFLNDIFSKMNDPRRFNQQQASDILRSIDANSDGKASKMELFLMIKKILSTPTQPNQQMYGQQGPNQQQNWQQGPNYGQQPNNQWGQQPNNQWGQQPNNQWGQQPQQSGWGQQQPPQQSGWGQQQPPQQSGWGQQQPQQQSGWGQQNQGQNPYYK